MRASEEVSLKLGTERGEQASHATSWKKRVPDAGNSKCKGPGMGRSSVCWRNRGRLVCWRGGAGGRVLGAGCSRHQGQVRAKRCLVSVRETLVSLRESIRGTRWGAKSGAEDVGPGRLFLSVSLSVGGKPRRMALVSMAPAKTAVERGFGPLH